MMMTDNAKRVRVQLAWGCWQRTRWALSGPGVAWLRIAYSGCCYHDGYSNLAAPPAPRKRQAVIHQRGFFVWHRRHQMCCWLHRCPGMRWSDDDPSRPETSSSCWWRLECLVVSGWCPLMAPVSSTTGRPFHRPWPVGAGGQLWFQRRRAWPTGCRSSAGVVEYSRPAASSWPAPITPKNKAISLFGLARSLVIEHSNAYRFW